MVDGIKCWHAKTNLQADHITLNGIRFTRNNHEGYGMNGSLHKSSNGGLHNANDYLMSSFKNTLNQLYDDIGLNADITAVNGFEFGVNVIMPINPNDALKRIILYKSNPGTFDKNYKEFKYKDYTVKIYNKSEFTKIEPYQSDNILRIEIKVTKMRFIRIQGIHCKVLSDLLDSAVWERLEQLLIEAIQNCLIIDFSCIEINKLADKDRIRYGDYINPAYWVNLNLNRKKYYQEHKRCERFLIQHSDSTLKNDIINLIQLKCNELRDVSRVNKIGRKWNKITVYPSVNRTDVCDKITVCHPINQIKKGDKITVSSNINKTRKNDKITIKIKGDIVPPKSKEIIILKKCKGCGKIITNPIKGQLYCSANEVGYVQAHKCRNNASNPRNNLMSAIRRINSFPLIFDLYEGIPTDRLRLLER